MSIWLRYIKDKKSKLDPNDEIKEASQAHSNWLELIKCVERKDPAMLEIYKRISWHHFLAADPTIDKNVDEMFMADEKLFDKIKKIISGLVVVKPAERLKLKDARDQLIALDGNNALQEFNDFLLLKK